MSLPEKLLEQHSSGHLDPEVTPSSVEILDGKSTFPSGAR
jgi:hypothetical protein